MKKLLLILACLMIVAPHSLHADDVRGAERLAGPLVAFGGYTLLKDFEFKLKSRTNIFGVTAVVAGAAILDDALCSAIEHDRIACFKMESTLSEAVEAFPEVSNALNRGFMPAKCPTPAVDEKAADNFSESYNILVDNNTEFFTRYAVCGGDKKSQLSGCIKRIGKALNALCIDYKQLNHKQLPSSK